MQPPNGVSTLCFTTLQELGSLYGGLQASLACGQSYFPANCAANVCMTLGHLLHDWRESRLKRRHVRSAAQGKFKLHVCTIP